VPPAMMRRLHIYLTEVGPQLPMLPLLFRWWQRRRRSEGPCMRMCMGAGHFMLS